MATAMLMNWSGVTLEQYDACIRRLGVEGSPAPGIFLHVAGPTADGVRILELWDTREGFERFLRDRLLPTARDIGFEGEPNVEFYPVHNVFVPDSDALTSLGTLER